jgi:hypothetical protein
MGPLDEIQERHAVVYEIHEAGKLTSFALIETARMLVADDKGLLASELRRPWNPGANIANCRLLCASGSVAVELTGF